MPPRRRWRRARGPAIAEIIGVVLLVALTLIAGVILWTFHFTLPPNAPTVGFVIRSGSSNPVWGDPTDCQPNGYTLLSYPITGTAATTWYDNWETQCDDTTNGNFSLLNTTQVIIASHSPLGIPLDEINFAFVCYNTTSTGGTTTLVSGSLASMTWFPGSSTSPASNAPDLGYCGSFDAGGYGGGSYGTLYNRLGMFIPISTTSSALENGDTFLLYIHNGGWPIDFDCVNSRMPDYDNAADCSAAQRTAGLPTLDSDDYHGAPPWCFTKPGACEIYLTYTGNPTTLLAAIPVNLLAPPTSVSLSA